MSKIYKINFQQGKYDKFLIGEITDHIDYVEVKGNNGKIHRIYRPLRTSIF